METKPLTEAEIKLKQDRQLWQAKYEKQLKKSNKFALRCQSKNIDYTKNEKYIKAREIVNKYWLLLHNSKPVYKP